MPLNFEILKICFCIFIWCVKKRQKWFFVLSFFLFFLVLIRPCNLRRMLHAIKNETRVKFDMMMYYSSASFIANFCTMLHKYRMISNETKQKRILILYFTRFQQSMNSVLLILKIGTTITYQLFYCFCIKVFWCNIFLLLPV